MMNRVMERLSLIGIFDRRGIEILDFRQIPVRLQLLMRK